MRRQSEQRDVHTWQLAVWRFGWLRRRVRRARLSQEPLRHLCVCMCYWCGVYPWGVGLWWRHWLSRWQRWMEL